ncbi:MAG: lipid A deacylase LpxR family protein [Sedimenticola sp.]|nr:lipid A deacylase LpxR family protein [Sedimenticola sp.]
MNPSIEATETVATARNCHAVSRLVPFLLLSLLVFEQLPAATPLVRNQDGGFWSIQFENDLWGSGDDRFYSHGSELSYLSLDDPPGWLLDLGRGIPLFRMGDVNALQYSFGQKIFTPQNTQTSRLVTDDRPYAGWLYASAKLLSRYRSGPRYQVGNVLGVTLGLVGPSSLAGDIQNGYHDLIGVNRAQGWDNQLKDEPGLLLTYTRKWQYFHDLPGGLEFETSPHLVGALGNIYTYAGGGMMLRIGQGLQNDIAPPSIRPGFPGIPYFHSDDRLSWYLFAGIEGRALARNIFLDGNTFRDSHRVDREPLVADLQFGVAFHVRGIRVAVSNIWRSREFEGQAEPVQFGAINISFPF